MLAGVLRLDTGNGLIYFRARQPHNEGSSRSHGSATPQGGSRRTSVPYTRHPPTATKPGEQSARTLDRVMPPHFATTARRPLLRVALIPVVAGAVGAAVLLAGTEPALALVLPFIVVADVLVAATRGTGAMRETLLLSGLVQPAAQLLLVGARWPPGSPRPGSSWRGASRPCRWSWWPPSGCGASRRRRPGGSSGPTPGPGRWPPRCRRSFQRLDVVVVAFLAGPAEAAFYVAATRFKVVGQLVGQGLAQGVQAELVQKFAQESRKRRAPCIGGRRAPRWL